MEGLAEFVSKSFEDKSKETIEANEKTLRTADTYVVSRDSSPVHVDDVVDDEVPTDLSLVKIDVCSSRPDTPQDERHEFDTGEIKEYILLLFLSTCTVA